MARFTTIISAAAIGLLSTTAFAQPNLGDLSFNDPWIRGSVPGQKNGAGYLVIDNKSNQSGALTAITSDRADRVELHTIIREGGVTKMREVQEIPIPANGSVSLQPGGYHVMFIGLTQAFIAGESVPVMLNFADGQTTEVTFDVKPPTFTGGGSKQSQGDHSGHGMMKKD